MRSGSLASHATFVGPDSLAGDPREAAERRHERCSEEASIREGTPGGSCTGTAARTGERGDRAKAMEGTNQANPWRRETGCFPIVRGVPRPAPVRKATPTADAHVETSDASNRLLQRGGIHHTCPGSDVRYDSFSCLSKH